jgi:hypothetical protein
MSLDNENYFENLYWIWTMKINWKLKNDFEQFKWIWKMKMNENEFEKWKWI